MNSASPTTQTYPGERLRALPMCELPAMSSTMVGILPGVDHGDQKLGRQLQVIFDRNLQIGVQRAAPGSIVSIAPRDTQRQSNRVEAIQDVPPDDVKINFDLAEATRCFGRWSQTITRCGYDPKAKMYQLRYNEY